MAKIIFEDVTLQYPLYNSKGMSLRNHLVRMATGGIIERDTAETTVVTALRNVCFSISEGDSVGLIGHNGAGKSSLLRTIAGIYKPRFGSIQRTGKISTVFELGAGLEPELTGYENIINLGLMLGVSPQQAKSSIPEIEAFTELGDFLKLPVYTYSSGMTMRLMFAAATAITPEILLIDEMLSTGDESFQKKSLLRMKNLISEAKIIVIASHDMNLIDTHCNRFFHLEHGELKELSRSSFLELKVHSSN